MFQKKILMYVINLALLFFKRNYIMFKNHKIVSRRSFRPFSLKSRFPIFERRHMFCVQEVEPSRLIHQQLYVRIFIKRN